MGYNLKNATNRKKAYSEIPKWLSLRSLDIKSKFIRQFEFVENLEDLYGKCCWTNNISIKIFLYSFKKLFRLSLILIL